MGPWLPWGRVFTICHLRGVVPLTFRKLSKINSWKYTMPEITFMVRNFKPELYMCVHSMALGTSTKFRLEIFIRSMISAIHKFQENILESSRNVSQAGKLKFFGTRPNWVVSYIAYTKFHSPRPVFHSPGKIFTRIGERASASFTAC